MVTMPSTFYVPHGSPFLWIDDSVELSPFLKSWKQKICTDKPKSILMISGHWDTKYPTVLVVDRHETVHDYVHVNLPEAVYNLTYPAPGTAELANRVKELLMGAGFNRVDQDTKRGLDHGSWVPLLLMYPESDIPVCQLSLQSHQDATYHYNLGKALAPLKDEGVLIIGSGSTTQNFSDVGNNAGAIEFDTWLKDRLLEAKYDDVINYLDKAPNGKMVYNSPDHIYPLHVVMGAAGEKAKAKLIHHSWLPGIGVSCASYQFISST